MLPIIDQDEYDKYILSPRCKKVRNRITMSKNIFFVLAMVILVVSLLFIVSAQTAYIELNIDQSTRVDQFTVPVFNNASYAFDNITIDPYGDSSKDLDWKVRSVEIYASSYSPMINKNDSMNYVLYGISSPMIEKPLNTLLIYFYNSLTDTKKIGYSDYFNSLNGLDSYHAVSSEYVLSYIKIDIVPLNFSPTNNFAISYYYFFQGDDYISTKVAVVTCITINALHFDANAYSSWYNWKYDNGGIPLSYPYIINTTIVDYLYIKNPIDNRLYVVEWS